MKIKSIITFYVLLVFLVSTLGCLEYTNQLSSDFTSTEINTYSVVNSSNIVVFHTCEKEKINLNLQEKYVVKGNITNLGENSLIFPEVNVSFYNRNKRIPSFSNDDAKSHVFMKIEPNQTINFTLDKTFLDTENIKYYKINVGYN